MNLKEIQALIEALEQSELESITYKDKTFEVELKRSHQTHIQEHATLVPQTVTQASVVQESQPEGDIVKSPLVGIYYSKPTPEASEYTAEGKHVNKGDVLCIIEAMKVMNEIKSSVSGTVQKVHLNDGETVDFDQPLFTIV